MDEAKLQMEGDLLDAAWDAGYLADSETNPHQDPALRDAWSRGHDYKRAISVPCVNHALKEFYDGRR